MENYDIWNSIQSSGIHIDELQDRLNKLFPQFQFSMEEMLEQILSGDIIGALSGGLEAFLHGLAGQIQGMRNIFVYLLILGIVSALLVHFTEIFENRQISEIGFYIIYLLIITILMRCFQEVALTAANALENIITFIKIFVPTYLIAMGVSGSVISAYTSYHVMFLLIYAVEAFMQFFFLPLIYAYVFMGMLNGIWIEERLTVLMEFIQKCIRGGLRISFGVVTGLSVFQSLITPVIDSVKAGTVRKTMSMLPGIGNVADGVMELVIGSAVLIKNSIGVLVLILLIIVCAVPVIKIFIMAFVLKLSAGFMGLISDKKISGCTNKVAEGAFLLMKVVSCAVILFMIMIAVAAYTTNRGV